MSTAAISHPEKSTNVRVEPWPLRALRAGLQTVEAGSPDLAARLGMELMFRTTRRPAPAREREVLDRGRSLRIRSPHGPLAAWSWGEGPVVVLVHGWNGRAGQLGAFVDPLVSQGFQVVAFDAPAHGQSPGTHASLPHFADALDAVVESVRPHFGPVHAVVAHSMGGAATTYAMSRWRRAPEIGHERALRDLGLPARRFVFVAPPVDVRDFVRSFALLMGLGRASEEAIVARVEARFTTRMDDLYAPALARGLTAPLLVIHDEDDREVPLRCGRLLAGAWPEAELEVTHGLGHTRILRDPGVVRRVAAFVGGAR